MIRLFVARDAPLFAFSSRSALQLVRSHKMGEFNTEFRWSDIVDQSGRLEATIENRGRKAVVCDIAPRQVQGLHIVQGKKFSWNVRRLPGNSSIQKGITEVGKEHILVLKDVKLPPGIFRLVVSQIP